MQHYNRDHYRYASLPKLPYDDDAFDMLLSSHLLFLYDAQLDAAFHKAAITEMMRVAKEVRIYPLVSAETLEVSTLLMPIMKELSVYRFRLEEVAFGFMPHATHQLVIRRLA